MKNVAELPLASLLLLAACAWTGAPVPASLHDDGGSVTPVPSQDASVPAQAEDGGIDAGAPWDATVDAAADPFGETLVGTDVPTSRVGILYSVWHAAAATVQRAIAADGGTPLTLEDVLRSNGARAYADIYPNGMAAAADGFYYMATPRGGFYCIYRARPGESGYVPDCPGITATLTTHAAELIAAGVDHVVVDDSNLTGTTDEQSVLLQIRPTEVLFEEWAALRAAGVKTPQIAVWNPTPTGATQWQALLALYQVPAYDGLVLHDKASGKKVFFLVDPGGATSPDPAIVAQIESNGGKNDVVVQRMWTLDSTSPTLDKWAFMSFCQASGHATTTPVGLAACDQPYAPASTLGSAVSVSPSYQTGYGSLPWGAPGKLGGFTFRQQWGTALSVMPKTVFVSSWNEAIAQPQPDPFTSDPYARSVGLERDPGGSNLFVDTFGAELSRDVEPTVERGTADYDLLASCVRVFRANALHGTTGCTATAEACCDETTATAFANVLALRDDATNDSVLTTSTAERTSLVGAGYRAVCARYGTPSAFCVDATEPATPFGPFVAFTHAATGRAPLYRCLSGTNHFATLDATCEGTNVEGLLAYVATAPSSEMPRRLERCYAATTGEHIEALGFDCPAGTKDEGTLGFVK